MLLAADKAEDMLDEVTENTTIVSLHTADPGNNGADEITGGHRVTLTGGTDWSAYATVSGARVRTNANEEEFTDEADADETATHFTLWESDGTTFILSNALTNPQAITTGNPILIPEGQFTFGLVIDDSI